MRAVIVAAGEGTRLRPYTVDRPKAMVPLAGTSMLGRMMERLADVEIHDVTVVGGYCHEQLVLDPATKLVVNERYGQTNMVTSLFCATDAFDGTDDVLVTYADIVLDRAVLPAALMKRSQNLALPVNTKWLPLWQARMDDPLADAETLRVSRDGILLEIGDRPSSLREVSAQFMGLIVVPAKMAKKLAAFAAAQPDIDTLATTGMLARLILRGWTIDTVPIAGGWLEIDSVDDLHVYELLERRGKLDQFCSLH